MADLHTRHFGYFSDENLQKNTFILESHFELHLFTLLSLMYYTLLLTGEQIEG